MKKTSFKSVSLILLTAIQISLYSQSGFGVSAGVNYSTLEDVESILLDVGLEAAPVAGLYYTIDCGRLWNILNEFQYSAKGFSTLASDGSRMRTRNFYLDLMPQIEFRPAKIVSISAGVNLGYNIGERSKQAMKKWDEPFIEVSDTLDFGGLLGLRFYLGRVSWNLIYNHGLVNRNGLEFTDFNGAPIPKPALYTRNIQLTAGYRIFN
ncbi:MAG TPA: outer membrane beta-barrel protein [Flavilitoribacter sp.]|nr:outer membrane beta-barrel protein [Flavilitoribacter sp.]HMQ86840.1 outer membrane beta-barrel protein [Flavilitoribacter sp.]